MSGGRLSKLAIVVAIVLMSSLGFQVHAWVAIAVCGICMCHLKMSLIHVFLEVLMSRGKIEGGIGLSI